MRKIIHVDMDYFYAQVEELKDPGLKNIPFAVGGNSSRSVITTANYKAREFGVRSGISSKVALSRCPSLTLVKSNFQEYKDVSKIVFGIFREFTDKVEGLSLDEAYLDVTDCSLFCNSAYYIAREIRGRILRRTGLTASAGISYNKFLAKYACSVNKPNGQFLIPPAVSEEYFGSIPVKEISGVGPVFQARLAQEGIEELRDLWRYEKDELYQLYGKAGVHLYYCSRGKDNRKVESTRLRKSLSVESTFSQNLLEIKEMEASLQKLFEELTNRLEKHGDKEIYKLFVKIKFHDFEVTTIEKRIYQLNFDEVFALFKLRLEEQKSHKEIRLVGVGVKFRAQEEQQLVLF